MMGILCKKTVVFGMVYLLSLLITILYEPGLSLYTE